MNNDTGLLPPIAGVAGGIFGAYFSKRESKLEYLLSAIFGGLAAYFLNPLFILIISKEFDINEADLISIVSSTGFVIGLFAFTITGRVYSAIVAAIEWRLFRGKNDG